MINNVTVFNIRNCFSDIVDGEIGENAIQDILSDFSCSKNPDIEKFLKAQSIEFTKKNQSVTYLVFSNDDAALLGYFTLTIKPISINPDHLSNTVKRRIARVSTQNPENGQYSLAAYLIAQLGKNYTNGMNHRISGKELLELALKKIEELRYEIGGMVVFLEAEENDFLMNFYENQNHFKRFGVRETKYCTGNKHKLVQLLKVL
ncbi:MAG: GNAT family acetyltransferase [Lachnospiraceae bacterium]|nr:GNAT family acetyltransferase [Lachnospiraceae bacterium]